MKSEPQQFQELLEEEKDIEEEIFGEKREKLQEKDILREEFEEKKEYEVIEDKRIEKEIVREENIEFNTESSSKNKIPLDIYEEKVKTSEITVKKVEEKSKKIEFRVIGQVFGTFILVERDGVFEIYDQHIVHERILYEKLKAQYYGTKVSMQQLLVPIRILVDPRERELIFEEEENFTKAGFEIDRFSDNEILIRAVPMLDLRDSIENIFREILKNIKENRNIDIRESILISMSCKGAIKANEKLNHEEMERIVRELHEIGEYTCPHGRPIITKITRDDLEKLFKRK